MSNVEKVINKIYEYNSCSLVNQPKTRINGFGTKCNGLGSQERNAPYTLNEELEFTLNQNSELQRIESELMDFLHSEKPCQLPQEKLILIQFIKDKKKLLLLTTLSHYTMEKLQQKMNPTRILFLDYL